MIRQEFGATEPTPSRAHSGPLTVVLAGPFSEREWLRAVRTEVCDTFPQLATPRCWLDMSDDEIEATDSGELTARILADIDSADIVVHLARAVGRWQWSVVTRHRSEACRGIRDILTEVRKVSSAA